MPLLAATKTQNGPGMVARAGTCRGAKLRSPSVAKPIPDAPLQNGRALLAEETVGQRPTVS